MSNKGQISLPAFWSQLMKDTKMQDIIKRLREHRDKCDKEGEHEVAGCCDRVARICEATAEWLAGNITDEEMNKRCEILEQYDEDLKTE
jgi:hypothetical protein